MPVPQSVLEGSVTLQQMLPRRFGPPLLVAAGAVTTWFIFGVGLGDIIRFLGYDIAFVALPGMALLWALRGKRGGLLVTVALGWPLGQTLEILAFSASAATGLRDLFTVYPLVVILPSAFVIRRRWRSPQRVDDEPRISIAAAWTTAALISVGLLYLTLMLIPQAPLPGRSVPTEYLDFPYFIGLINQVMNHWPPTSPGLYGTPLHYEWFVFFHIAAAAQVTGLPIPTIALRLDYVPTIVVVACQLLVVGRTMGRSAWTGVAAIGVVFLLGPLDLTTDANGPAFGDNVFVHLWDSWTFPFGLIFLLAILYLLTERLRAETTNAPRAWGAWGLIVLLMIGASGSKATVLPVIIVGTVLFVVLRAAVRRSISIPMVAASVAGVVVFVLTYLVIYGGGAPDTKVEPFAWLAVTPPVIFANLIRHAEIRAVVLPFAYAAGLAGMMLPLAGMLYLLRREHRRAIATFALPFCMYVGGVLIALAVHQSSGSELYFQDTGYVAGSIVAAEGFRRAWLDVGRSLPCSRRSALAAFAGCVALLILVVKITSHAVASPDAVIGRYAAIAIGAVMFVIVWALIRRARHRSAAGVTALILIPILAVTALSTPILVSPMVGDVLAGVPLTSAPTEVTQGMLSALHWIRDHSSPNTVFAVNNHWLDPAGTDGKYFYYTAFSERQVFIEAYDPIRYGITPGVASPAASTFAFRQAVNDAVFTRADEAALLIMTRHYAVRFLLLDHHLGPNDPAVLQLGHVVFSNSDATVLAVG
jgi:hypothetical protein